MSMRRVLFSPALFATFVASQALAHEYWIEPDRHAVAPGDPIAARMRVGQDFAGPIFPYLSHRFHNYAVHDRTGTHPVKALEGDEISARIDAAAAGLTIITYQSTADTATFETLTDFADYLDYEGLGRVVEQRRTAALPAAGFAEDYVRCAKTLIQAGPVEAADQDRPTGLPAELVALDNPFTPGLARLRVRMLWQGAPEAGLQVAVFHRAEQVTRQLYTTDAEGVVEIDVTRPGRYLLNAVHIQRTGRYEGTVWESHWASLTFAIGPE